MGEFFKLWRRKIGLATLLMSCVFMGVGIRSIVVEDSIRANDFFGRSHLFHSRDGAFIWHRWRERADYPPPFVWNSSPIKGRLRSKMWFSWATTVNPHGKTGEIVNVPFTPYWILAAPFTLLSAWLLLSKLRKAKSGQAHV